MRNRSVHLTFEIVKLMDESNTTNYILTGFLSPDIKRLFAPVIDILQGEVVIVHYAEVFDANNYIRQILDRLMSYRQNIAINLFGLSLGCNIVYRVADQLESRLKSMPIYTPTMTIYALFPVIMSDCLKNKVFSETSILVAIGKVLVRIFGDLILDRKVLSAYGKKRTFLELLSGAEAIIETGATNVQLGQKVVMILAERDQYINNDTAEFCCYLNGNNSKVYYVDSKHCWNVGLFERKKINLTANELNQIAQIILAS